MSGLRAITAVIALYAFVLQGFLGGLMPVSVGADGHALCLSGLQAGDPAPDRPAPHTHADCCTAAQIAATALPPPASVPLAWPTRRSAAIAFGPHAAHGARAPPGAIPLPRGPPVA